MSAFLKPENLLDLDLVSHYIIEGIYRRLPRSFLEGVRVDVHSHKKDQLVARWTDPVYNAWRVSVYLYSKRPFERHGCSPSWCYDFRSPIIEQLRPVPQKEPRHETPLTPQFQPYNYEPDIPWFKSRRFLEQNGHHHPNAGIKMHEYAYSGFLKSEQLPQLKTMALLEGKELPEQQTVIFLRDYRTFMYGNPQIGNFYLPHEQRKDVRREPTRYERTSHYVRSDDFPTTI